MRDIGIFEEWSRPNLKFSILDQLVHLSVALLIKLRATILSLRVMRSSAGCSLKKLRRSSTGWAAMSMVMHRNRKSGIKALTWGIKAAWLDLIAEKQAAELKNPQTL